MVVVLVILVVSGALIGGAAWGTYGRLSKRLEGFLIAMAGGALIVAVVSELIEPAAEAIALYWLTPVVLLGAFTFVLVDSWVDKKFGEDNGGGLLLAITLDGIPENLALGVALIGAGFGEVAALAASILLSNLPEAAGGSQSMRKSGLSRGKVMLLWSATAALIAAAAFIGYTALSDAPQWTLALIRGFAAGAVVASLATEVFPKAFRDDHYQAGIAVTIGLMLAVSLNTLSSG